MMTLLEIERLSETEKAELILSQWRELQDLRARKAALEVELGELKTKLKELEDKLSRPAKDCRNSSIPPSQTRKANQPAAPPDRAKGHRKASVGRAGGGRRLHPTPDQFIVAKVRCCPHCREPIPEETQGVQAVYDKIELPPVKPMVTRVTQYGGRCPHCDEPYVAPVPTGMEAGTPFGRSIQALATYLRYSHAISYERLSALFREVFDLSISEGALSNMFQSINVRLDHQVAEILDRLRHSRLVCSDETSARVNGRTQWEWVFQNKEVCVHVIRPSRGHGVISEVFAEPGPRPTIWVSDLYSAQRNHPAQQWQVCLAHQLRDCQFAIEAGDQVVAPVMKSILLRSVVIHQRRDTLAESTLAHYRRDLDRRVERCLERQPTNNHGIRLKKRYTKIKENLFLFLEDASIPPTNNSSEQAIRMSVIFRKVTNCFRSDWGRDLFAAVRSVVNTGKRQGLSAYQSILRAVGLNRSLFDSS